MDNVQRVWPFVLTLPIATSVHIYLSKFIFSVLISCFVYLINIHTPGGINRGESISIGVWKVSTDRGRRRVTVRMPSATEMNAGIVRERRTDEPIACLVGWLIDSLHGRLARWLMTSSIGQLAGHIGWLSRGYCEHDCIAVKLSVSEALVSPGPPQPRFSS